jgi:sugar phosphate isomerase/epimerase
MTDNPTIAVSSWALHRALGAPPILGPEHGPAIPSGAHGKGRLSLLELPAELASHGYRTMEICHFHLPSREAAYLDELRAALEGSGVSLLSLLVDEGDLTHPEHGRRDLEWIREWIPVAAQLGAERMRVIAGKTTAGGATETVIGAFRELAAQAGDAGVRLTTENWFSVTATPAPLLHILDETRGEVGLNLDFGNWGGETKYQNLAQIAPRAETCHAQANSTGQTSIDREDYGKILALLSSAGFNGPFTLVESGPGSDEWQGLEVRAQFIRDLASSPA